MQKRREKETLAYVNPLLFPKLSFFFPLCKMANYFSNHSTSRFLANNTNTSPTSQPQTQMTTPTPRDVPPRRMSSKHFSTTVNTSQPVASNLKDAATASTPSSATSTQVHPLRITYVRILSRVNDCRALEHLYYYCLLDGSFGFVNNVHRVIKMLIMKRA